jgi:hypothetical protein
MLSEAVDQQRKIKAALGDRFRHNVEWRVVDAKLVGFDFNGLTTRAGPHHPQPMAARIEVEKEVAGCTTLKRMLICARLRA